MTGDFTGWAVSIKSLTVAALHLSQQHCCPKTCFPAQFLLGYAMCTCAGAYTPKAESRFWGLSALMWSTGEPYFILPCCADGGLLINSAAHLDWHRGKIGKQTWLWMQPGTYSYQYLVDGTWMTSPDAAVGPDDDGHLCNKVIKYFNSLLTSIKLIRLMKWNVMPWQGDMVMPNPACVPADDRGGATSIPHILCDRLGESNPAYACSQRRWLAADSGELQCAIRESWIKGSSDRPKVAIIALRMGGNSWRQVEIKLAKHKHGRLKSYKRLYNRSGCSGFLFKHVRSN